MVVEPGLLVDAALHLRDELGFNFLSDVTAVDYLGWGDAGVSGYIGTRAGRDLNAPSTQGFALLPPPNGQCVPQMGTHASDLSSPELAQTNPATFTKTMILGYYKGAMTFIEPMMTQAYLQQKEAFTLNIPMAGELGKSTQLPTTFSGSFDATAKAYTFTFTGFKAAK